MNTIRALPATTSYAAVSFGVSSPRRAAVIAKAEPSDKSVEIMRKFSEQNARKSGTYFCVNKTVTSVVIKVPHFPIYCKTHFFMRNVQGNDEYIVQAAQ